MCERTFGLLRPGHLLLPQVFHRRQQPPEGRICTYTHKMPWRMTMSTMCVPPPNNPQPGQIYV